MRIGIDFGGVIVRQTLGNSPIDADAGLELMIPSAFECITKLVTISEGNVWIVSKASMATQIATRIWLGKTGFYKLTGFNPAHIHFCAKRREKAEICLQLKLTHFIDDSEEVIQSLIGLVPNLYQFGSETNTTWQQVLKNIQATLH